MKKIALVLAVLLFATPAMAALSVTCSTVGKTVTVSYDAGTGALPRGFALDISLGAGTISNAPTAAPASDFYIYPGSITIAGGAVTGWGQPVAAGGNGNATMTIEMGSLYAAGDAAHTNAPASSGNLFSFDTSTACVVYVKENADRGGVVMEDGSDSGLSDPVSTCQSGCDCLGDLGPDGWVSSVDIDALVDALLEARDDTTSAIYTGNFWFQVASGTYNCYDLGGDGWVSSVDIDALVDNLLEARDDTTSAIYTGNFWYQCP